MPAYLLAQVTVRDEERFTPYVDGTSRLIESYGGEVLDVTRAIDVLEGSWPLGALTALVRFPSLATLRAFWESPGNAEMKRLRAATSSSNVAVCMSLSDLDSGDDG